MPVVKASRQCIALCLAIGEPLSCIQLKATLHASDVTKSEVSVETPQLIIATNKILQMASI